MKETRCKYGIGDLVEIVDYGHRIWERRGDEVVWIDLQPSIVGQQGIIDSAKLTQNIPQYSLDGIRTKHAWYNEDQLKLINKNPNNERGN